MTPGNGNYRPDPDALLADVKAQEQRCARGRLKIFFGMSAGVGKTFSMLEEARKRATEGVDVAVGYAEPHIRPETEAILVALDIIPYRLVVYRGTTLKEFDLDAALIRKPALCCVDELAHTNAPGMRHPKRWQDVSELLDAGIDVYTTLNVQHLESVNDLVERITGVRVRETLPDAVFDSADEVELVDIAPNELLERFREGRIYKPEQVERASRHFFTKGNLIALRELALRKTAERVDQEMQQHRRDERLGRLVPSGERVLVCVGPSPLSARLVRSAWRLSQGLRAPLIAVHVERPGTSRHAAQAVESNLKLAEDLGATIEHLSGEKVAVEVLASALRNNVTKIVIGKPLRPRWKELLFGSVVDDLIRGSGEIDIYVIRGEAGGDDAKQRRVHTNAGSPDWVGFGIAGAVVAAATAIGWPLYHILHLENENVLMLFLLGVLWVATRRSRGAAILTSVLGVAAFDLLFVKPFYSFAVTDNQYVVTFGVMLVTAIVISTLTHRVRLQADSSRQRERRTAALLRLSNELASASTIQQIASAAARHAGDVLYASTAVLLADEERRLQHAPHELILNDKELGVAQWAYDHDRPAGRGTDTLPAAAGTYVPLIGSRGRLGVLAVIATDAAAQPWSSERREAATAIASQAAVALERAGLADEARQAWEMVEAELLRNTLLSGVSHELRTPLAGITGAATLLAESDTLTDAARREMLSTLVSEAQRMNRLITNLLDMTRMETGGLSLKKDWTPLVEVIGAAMHQLDTRLRGRRVVTHIADDVPLIHMDAAAVEQVLVNLLDNAIEYTPADTQIEVSAMMDGPGVRVHVDDHGPGLPPGSEKRVFDKFYRARPDDGSPNRGIGLGLAICRAIVEAHGGWVRASNRVGGGASFCFMLPVGGTPPTVEYDGRQQT